MAYNHFQMEVMVSKNDAMLSTAAQAYWAPGYQPVRIRAVAVVVTTAVTDTAATVDIILRPTAGSTSGETSLDVITVPTTAAQGDVIYVDGLDTIVSPGQELEFDGGGEGTAGAGHIILFYEPSWEHPANNSDMTASA